MSVAKAIGNTAENLATDLHERARFEILERNFRDGSYEVDLIAKRGNIIHFVEVKARRTLADANFALSSAQFQRIAKVAEKYMHGKDEFMQIDAILVDQKLQWERIDNIMIA